MDGKLKISILCPTRGRPSNMERLVKSAIETSSQPLEFSFYFDYDDLQSRDKFEDLINKYENLGHIFTSIIEPRFSCIMSEMTNRCYNILKNPEIIFTAGDDVVFRTPGWDEEVIENFEEFPDKILCCYGEDGYNKDIGTHLFLHANWVKTVGYVVPPIFSADYSDTWLNDVADRIGRKRKLPFYIEHIHYAAGKASIDKTMQEKLMRVNTGDSTRKFHETSAEREVDAEKLREFIKTYER